jgi:hypothetical protein
MRRSYISPEFTHKDINGSLNMVEESNFFGSKMLEIEDSIYIDVQDIIYFQNSNGEQIDLSSEQILDSNIYSSSTSKKNYHLLELDQTQSTYTRDNATRWIITIDLRNILIDYIFAEMKRWRTFEGIKNNMTLNNDVNSSLKNYINNNVLDRYKINRVDLYVENKDLRSQNLLRFKNNWNSSAFKPEFQMKKLQTETKFDGTSIKLFFNQEVPSTLYNFNYYFNLLFTKI